MRVISTDDVRNWIRSYGGADLARAVGSIGQREFDSEYLDLELQIPAHLQFLLGRLWREEAHPPEAGAARGAAQASSAAAFGSLDSIPFFSLCYGLFLPLSYLTADRSRQLFGVSPEMPADAAAREALLQRFLERELGLTLTEKVGCLLGDLFLGRKSGMKRDGLLRLLSSMRLLTRREMLDRLARVGDVAVLFAESRPVLRGDPPLTAAEVVRTLRFLPELRTREKFDILRGLLERCGRLEAYFLARLVLRRAGFGTEFQQAMLAGLLARRFNVAHEMVAHALALTDPFHVAGLLETAGPAGLQRVQLQPLVAVRPALAGGVVDDQTRFPVWIERKYDGIRLMLHKSTDARGSVLCGAYTRNRGDWLELVPGLDASIRALPAANAIVDGELFGTVLDFDRARPASVYEVYSAIQGQPERPVNLRFAAFDLIYLNGQDLTQQPLSVRRQWLASLLAPLVHASLPVPLSLVEGQLASSSEEANRLFHHFRAQGYEGIIAKDLNGPYLLASRDPQWMKRKPAITLDLAVVGATYAVTTKENAGALGSYVVAARDEAGAFEIVGDVSGVDQARDVEIRQEILREGLLTGRRIERPSSSGVRSGVELRPHLVATVRFEGIIRDQATRKLSLRDPKIVNLRADKPIAEADSMETLQRLYLREQVG